MPITFSTGGLFYAGARAVLGAAVRLYFRRIELNRPDRLPTFGPVLLVANHPSSLTDVLVLGAAVDRRLHFLAHSGLFRPWYRGFFLKAAGALPVYRREDEPSLTHRNDDTFRACHELFDRDGVIVIFPEGTSETDRSVKKFKTGAARLALGYDALPGRAGRLSIVPVGLHFTERTRRSAATWWRPWGGPCRWRPRGRCGPPTPRPRCARSRRRCRRASSG